MAVRIPRDLARTSFSIRAMWAAFALLGTWSADRDALAPYQRIPAIGQRQCARTALSRFDERSQQTIPGSNGMRK